MNRVWFADDATAGGTLQSLKQWWDELERIGPDFGYFANAPKSWLIVKEEHMTDAANIFANSGIQITKEGRRNLGAALGTQSFTEEFVTKQVQKWVEEVKWLAIILAERRGQPYSKIIGWLQCVLNFSLIRSAIQCIRGARSARHRPCRPSTDSSIALVAEEGRIPSC